MWYRLWTGAEETATLQEIEEADQLIAAHGEVMAGELINLLIPIMRRAWPKAKRFGSIRAYIPDAIRQYRAKASQERQREEEEERRQQEQRQAVQEEQHDRKLAEVWDTLPPDVQARIEGYVLATYPLLRGRPNCLLVACRQAMLSPGLAFFMT